MTPVDYSCNTLTVVDGSSGKMTNCFGRYVLKLNGGLKKAQTKFSKSRNPTFIFMDFV